MNGFSRPPQTKVPSVIALGLPDRRLNASQFKTQNAYPRQPLRSAARPGLIATQTPQAGELVEYGTFVGVTISSEHPEWRSHSSNNL